MDAFMDAVINATFKNAKNVEQLVKRVMDGNFEFKDIKKDTKFPLATKKFVEGSCNYKFKKGNLEGFFCNGKTMNGTLCNQHSRKKGQKNEIPGEYTLDGGYIVSMKGVALTEDEKLLAISKGYPIQCTSITEKTKKQCSHKCCVDGANKFICNVHFRQMNKKVEKAEKKAEKKEDKKSKKNSSSSDDSDDDDDEEETNQQSKTKLSLPVVVGKETVSKMSRVDASASLRMV